MSNRALLVLVISLACLVGLAGTNPTRQTYGAFLETELERALTHMERDDPAQRKVVHDLVSAHGKKLIRSVIQAHTARRNYGFFSVYETRLFNVDVTVIGVAGHFLPLDDEAALRRKLGQLVL